MIDFEVLVALQAENRRRRPKSSYQTVLLYAIPMKCLIIQWIEPLSTGSSSCTIRAKKETPVHSNTQASFAISQAKDRYVKIELSGSVCPPVET